jgi:hydrogenase maturation factor
MHDPTEGGLATGLWELAEAGGVGIDVDLDAVSVLPLCGRFSGMLGLDPVGLIASGTLLAVVAEGDVGAAIAACHSAGLPCRRIGSLTPADGVVQAVRGGSATLLPRFHQDEIARLFSTEGDP